MLLLALPTPEEPIPSPAPVSAGVAVLEVVARDVPATDEGPALLMLPTVPGSSVRRRSLSVF